MQPSLKLMLDAAPAQFERLCRLQSVFAAACNFVAPIARDNRCWNRVALHHLAYRQLRERFPQLGSQMACNAIYSVARTYRAVLQHRDSPWRLELRPNLPLPDIQFTDRVPVYFDRHTLSLRGSVLSMYTLDGRLHFELKLAREDRIALERQKVREIVLMRTAETFFLQVWLDEKSALPEGGVEAGDLPEYLVISMPEPAGPNVDTVVASLVALEH